MKGLSLLTDKDMRWLRKCVASKLMGLDFDDAWQECQIAIWKCGEAYQEETGIPFRQYVLTITKRRMNKIRNQQHTIYMSEYGRKKGGELPLMRSLDSCAPGVEEPMHGFIPDSSVVDPSVSLDKQRSWGYLVHALTDQERVTITQRLDGDTLQSVGDTLGVTRERVRQLETAALGKIDHARTNWEKVRPRKVTLAASI